MSDGSAKAPISVEHGMDLDIAGARTNPQPSPAQKEVGNYAKGHVRVHGMDIAIETPRGGTRSGVGKDGKQWFSVMPVHYGYVKGTKGNDGDALDVYLGANVSSPKVYALDQVDADSGKFDEHKFFLGFPNEHAAARAYHRSFSDGKAAQRVGRVTEMGVDDFKGLVGKSRARVLRQPIGSSPQKKQP